MNNAQVNQIIVDIAQARALSTEAGTGVQDSRKLAERLRVSLVVGLFAALSFPVSAQTLNYEVHLMQDMAEIKVTRSDATSPLRLASRRGRASDLRDLRLCGDETQFRPRVRSRALNWPAGASCLAYRVPVERARVSSRVRWPREVRALDPDRLLWLPDLESAAARVTLVSEQPVSAPWQVEGPESWRVIAAPGSSQGLLLTGSLSLIDIPGLGQPVAYVGPDRNRDKMERWMEWAVETNRQYMGDLPNPDAQIVLLHVSGTRGSPVPFGHVVRDHGESVRFYVDSDRSLSDLIYDWTASHELAHLFLPYVDERWISEGFASYLQNVLQVRGGAYTEDEAWRRLRDSFERAAAASGNMSPADTRRRGFAEARMMIYWSGAALALKADVALRRDHGTSLPELLAMLSECCLPAGESWSTRTLFARFDSWLDAPLFIDLLHRYENEPGMPPTASLFEDLGVGQNGLNASAPLAAIRRAIMTPPDTATWN